MEARVVAVALTELSREWLDLNRRGIKYVAIPNGVLLPLERREPELNPELWVGSADRLLLPVGRLVHVKGFDILLEAFHKLCGAFPQWRLVILGEGSERTQLEAKVREVELDDRVSIPGRAGNIAEWYARADLFVLSSRYEGSLNVLIEAMAHGTRVSDWDGILGPMEAGPRWLAYTISRLMTDHAKRQRMATRATEVRNRFSMDTVL